MTTQDTRKDPRAKVLTMTVRYKSATLDEFIEHHSHDVSRGGMFIKTPSPFPPGTLLKFEVKIASEQRVMQGVGRVVWKREAAEAQDNSRPAGMGVKFIKIDDESRKVIDQLIDARGDSTSNFESEAPEAVPPRPPAPPRPDVTPTPAPAAAGSNPLRKSTMIGLGAVSVPPESPSKETSPSFFPESQFDMPEPEDRTVMKQAAELLQDALREAGGSLEDVGTPAAPKASPAKASPPKVASPAAPSSSATSAKVAPPAPLPAAAPPTSEATLPKVVITDTPDPAKPGDSPSGRLVLEPRAASARARMAVTQPVTPKPAAAAAAGVKAPVTSAAPARAEAPRTRSAAIQEAAGVAADGGGGAKTTLAVLAAAAAALIVYFATRAPEPMPEPEPPPAPAADVPKPEPANVAPEPPAVAPEPSVAPVEPMPSAAAPASAAPSRPPLVEPVPAAPQPEPAPKAAPAPKPRPIARPKSVDSKEAPEPSTGGATAPAKQAPAPRAAPAPRPAPKPVKGDNPY